MFVRFRSTIWCQRGFRHIARRPNDLIYSSPRLDKIRLWVCPVSLDQHALRHRRRLDHVELSFTLCHWKCRRAGGARPRGDLRGFE
eukprot:scaffold81389_cov30-Tisochrysis_lutea.AAC.5